MTKCPNCGEAIDLAKAREKARLASLFKVELYVYSIASIFVFLAIMLEMVVELAVFLAFGLTYAIYKSKNRKIVCPGCRSVFKVKNALRSADQNLHK